MDNRTVYVNILRKYEKKHNEPYYCMEIEDSTDVIKIKEKDLELVKNTIKEIQNLKHRTLHE